MKNIKCTNDNILIKATIKKSVLILPDAKDNKINNSAEIEKVEIMGYGEKIKEQIPHLKLGDKIITSRNLFNEMNYNKTIGFPKLNSEMKIFEVYYFIKSFDIIAIIK